MSDTNNMQDVDADGAVELDPQDLQVIVEPDEAIAPPVEVEPKLEVHTKPARKTGKGRKSSKPDKSTAKIKTPQSEETSAEEIPLPEVEAAPATVLDSLSKKIAKAAPGVDTRTINRAVNLHQRGGTVGITKFGTLAFLPSKSPDGGGREILARSGKIVGFVADL